MSIKVSLYYWENALAVSHTEKLVLLALSDWCNDDGACYPSIPSIARRCCLTDRGVQKVTARLVESGEIRIDENAGMKTGQGSATNLYNLVAYQESAGVVAKGERCTGAAQRVNAVPQRVNAVPPKGERIGSPDPSVKPLDKPIHTLPREVSPQPSLLPEENAPKAVKASPYMPKGLRLPGGYVPAGAAANPVQVYYERFRYDVDRLNCPQEDDLARLCPDLGKLREVVIAYSQSGYRAGNVKLILDWYRDGIPQPGKAAGGRPSKQTLREHNERIKSNKFGRNSEPNRGTNERTTNEPVQPLTEQQIADFRALAKLASGNAGASGHD